MASVAHLLRDLENITAEIGSRLAEAEANARHNYVKARLIQKIFRGYITRKHLELLHASAIIIQKNWRGFVGRRIYRAQLKAKFEEMCRAYYCAMATVIQKSWRGYWIRHNVFSYYRLKSWLAFVHQQNKLMKSLAEMSQSKNNEVEMQQREHEAKEWIIYILYKLHHLLRTHQLSGIYSLPNTTEPSEIEKLLKCLKYKDFMVFYNAYMEDVRQSKTKELPPYILQGCKYGAHFEKEYHEHKKQPKDFIRDPYVQPKVYMDLEMKESSQAKKRPQESVNCVTKCQICQIYPCGDSQQE